MSKQQTIFVMMVASISVILFAGLAAIAVLRRNGNPGLKLSIKTVVIGLMLVFLAIFINVLMLGLNEG